MATDIKLIWDNGYMQGDFSFISNDLEHEEGLESAVLVSLYSDRRADKDDALDDINDKRGWWGDLTTDSDKIGSRLWEIDRSKTTKQTEIKAKEYIAEALQWLIDDGIASAIEVYTERQGTPGQDRLACQIKIKKSNGGSTTIKFDNLWTAQMEA